MKERLYDHRGKMRNLRWGWIFWQVLVPILGPIIFAAVAIAAWMSGPSNFKPNFAIVIDVSPWALTFYTMTLLGTSLNHFWDKLSAHRLLGAWMMLVALAVCIYAAFIVIWRHEPTYVPSASVYYVTLILLGAAVVLCYLSDGRKDQ